MLITKQTLLEALEEGRVISDCWERWFWNGAYRTRTTYVLTLGVTDYRVSFTEEMPDVMEGEAV